MPCNNCNSNAPLSTYDVTYFNSNQCFDCNDGTCPQTYNSKCVVYAGPNLPCSGIETDDNIETAFQKFDEKLCAVVGDYSTYNMGCLSAIEEITNEQQFVEVISEFVCDTREDLDTFTDSTFPTYQTAVNTRFIAVEVPVITVNNWIGLSSGDTLNQILTKIGNKVASIHNTELDISSVNWSQCAVVSPVPTTIAGGFDTLIDMICAIDTDSLPTFNNIGSCLPSPGSADTLVSTIGKIKTRLCQTGTIDTTTLEWGCLDAPTGTTNLQDTLQEIITHVDDYIKNKLTFSADFDITQTDEDDVCAGKTVALTTPINNDRLVASTVDDDSPGTLVQKLQAGVGVSLDSLTTPGQIIINAVGTTDDKKVKANSADNAPNYLDQKVNGATQDGITILAAYDSGTKKVVFTPSINAETLFGLLLDEVENNATLRARFCSIISSCPSPCDAPSDVEATPAIES